MFGDDLVLFVGELKDMFVCVELVELFVWFVLFVM